MSVISISIPRNAPITNEKGKAPPGKSANDLAGYRIALSREEAVQKCLLPANSNARPEIRMSQDLMIYSNSEYVYAISPIDLA